MNDRPHIILPLWQRYLLILLAAVMTVPFDALAAIQEPEAKNPDEESVIDAEIAVPTGRPGTDANVLYSDTLTNVVVADDYGYDKYGRKIFNPDPTRAVWLSALCPGLGQVYNRRYWKLPIVVGGFMGLGYATGWNNNQYQDYSQAYRDLMDNDPLTNSYMNFFPPNTVESDLSATWLQQVMKSRKDYYRRNRDLCIICVVGLYLLCMVDAYVDASMAHFDISPDLSMDLQPAIWLPRDSSKPTVGVSWAFNF